MIHMKEGDHIPWAYTRGIHGDLSFQPYKGKVLLVAFNDGFARGLPDVDIANLTKDGAKEIYYQDYWMKNRVPQMPEELKHIYFDMCVNQGRGRAVKILQRAANAKGADLVVDGGLGPKTIGALDGVELDRVRAYRIKYYADLVTRKPDLEKFYFGWFRRGLEV